MARSDWLWIEGFASVTPCPCRYERNLGETADAESSTPLVASGIVRYGQMKLTSGRDLFSDPSRQSVRPLPRNYANERVISCESLQLFASSSDTSQWQLLTKGRLVTTDQKRSIYRQIGVTQDQTIRSISTQRLKVADATSARAHLPLGTARIAPLARRRSRRRPSSHSICSRLADSRWSTGRCASGAPSSRVCWLTSRRPST